MSVVKREAELHERWVRESWIGQSFVSFLVKQVLKLEETKNEDPHGHIVSVRSDDLAPFIEEADLEYVTETMLEDIAETIWNNDDDGWREMFNQHLEATMADNAAHWQAMIDEEKKRKGII